MADGELRGGGRGGTLLGRQFHGIGLRPNCKGARVVLSQCPSALDQAL